jgi:hypothetical protein
MEPPMDPTAPIQINVRVDSPQVVVYRLWFQRPGEATWTLFANGTDEDSSSASGHMFRVGPLAIGSKLRYQFIISGNELGFFRIEMEASQNGSPLPNSSLRFEGNTDDVGTAVRQGEVAL